MELSLGLRSDTGSECRNFSSPNWEVGSPDYITRVCVENAAQEKKRTVPKPQEKPINKYMYIHNHLLIYLIINYLYIIFL